jgi:hypothetical protein
MRNLARRDSEMKVPSAIFCTLLLSYCRPGDAPPPATPLAETAYVKAAAGLNMREQPSQSARVLVLIPFRAKVTVTSRTPDTVYWRPICQVGQRELLWAERLGVRRIPPLEHAVHISANDHGPLHPPMPA